MNRARQKWYIITIVILSIVVLALVGFFVIKPAIENWRVDKGPTPDAIIVVSPGSIVANETALTRAIIATITAINDDLTITSVVVVGLTGVQLLDVPTGSSVINDVIPWYASWTIFIVGVFVQATEYEITLTFTSDGNDIIKEFSHIA